MRCAAQGAPGSLEGRSRPPAGRATLRALALRLALLLALAVLSGQPWVRQEAGPHSKGATHAGPVRLTARRRLLSEEPAGAPGAPPPDPQMVTFKQAVLLPPDGPNEGGGSVLLPGLAPLGTVLAAAADNLQPSHAACCTACRENPSCNVNWYCETEGGCANAAYNLSAPHQGCQLVFQEETRPGTGRPVLLVQAPGFVGGAPLRNPAPAIEGYDVFPGLGYWYRYDLTCNNSVSQPGSCGLRGGPQAHVLDCATWPACQVMMFFPDGRDYPGAGQPVVLLKGSNEVFLDIADANVNLNAVLYKKRAILVDGRGGLSGGAIAGIAVGAAAGVALLGLVAYLLVQRQRRQRLRQSVAAALPPGSGSSKGAGVTTLETGSPGSGDGPDAADDLDKKGELLAEEGQLAAGWSAPASLPSSGFSAVRSESMGGAAATKLPPGLELSLPVRAVPGLPRPPRMACPPPPPPSLTSSIAARGRPRAVRTAVAPAAAAAAAAASPGLGTSPAPGASPLPGASPSPSPQNGGLLTPHAAAAAAAARRASPGPRLDPLAPLLSQMPTYGWQRSIVDFSSIHFVLRPDGSYEELGCGASASVYKVLLNGVEPHAAKVFRLGSDPEMQLYFLEEASLLRLLRHRSVVGFAGVCVADGNGIILMELMEGGDLRTRIRELDAEGRRVFGWHQRGRKVALDVACALNYLHSSTYTHFDVKARNVLLSRDMTAKLADVGFARAMRATHHSIEGPTGTFDYMAPELLTGRKCNNSVDIYSFGVLLWEVVTSLYPARGSMREPLPEECPPEAAALMAACLQEDPALRPTAAQLVERLTQLQ
ncbi:hypothetical protein ABPG75_012523 [Micractinium tetrahymenae]